MFWLNLISSDQLCKTLEETSFRSMAQALPMVKKMVSSLVTSGSKVPRWVLTNFKDPNVELEINTKDVEELKTSLDELKNDENMKLRKFADNNPILPILKGGRISFKTFQKKVSIFTFYSSHIWFYCQCLMRAKCRKYLYK